MINEIDGCLLAFLPGFDHEQMQKKCESKTFYVTNWSVKKLSRIELAKKGCCFSSYFYLLHPISNMNGQINVLETKGLLLFLDKTKRFLLLVQPYKPFILWSWRSLNMWIRSSKTYFSVFPQENNNFEIQDFLCVKNNNILLMW